jgi:succinate-acetate transporter protein
MATIGPHNEPAAVHGNGGAAGRARTWEQLAIAEDHEAWLARTRVFLTPIAAPSIMGLFGFLIATGMLGAWQAGFYGTAATPLLIWPFALAAGGILQTIAAIASFRARDGVALAAHTAWGAFWLGWGTLQLLTATHVMAPVALGSANPSFAIWFIMLTAVTGMAAAGAAAQNLGIFAVLASLAAGSALTAAGFFTGALAVQQTGGWLFVVSAALALYTAGAMILEEAYGRTIIPLGQWKKGANTPIKGQPTDPLAYRSGMPGVRVGQ